MTELNKIELFEKGYTTFNIYNLNDVEINNALDELYTLSKKKFNCLRYCRLGGMEMSHLKDEFEKLEKEKQIQLKNDLYEIWYYRDVDKTKFRKPILNKIKSFFYNEEIENMNHECQISMYNDSSLGGNMKITIEIENNVMNVNYDSEFLALPEDDFIALLEDSILLLKSQLLSSQYSVE